MSDGTAGDQDDIKVDGDKCSFCGRAKSKEVKLIKAVATKNKFICFDCVKKFKEKLGENKG